MSWVGQLQAVASGIGMVNMVGVYLDICRAGAPTKSKPKTKVGEWCGRPGVRYPRRVPVSVTRGECPLPVESYP